MSESFGASELGTQALVAALKAAGEKLPGALRDDIIAAGESIVPALIDVMLHDDEVEVQVELTASQGTCRLGLDPLSQPACGPPGDRGNRADVERAC